MLTAPAFGTATKIKLFLPSAKFYCRASVYLPKMDLGFIKWLFN